MVRGTAAPKLGQAGGSTTSAAGIVPVTVVPWPGDEVIVSTPSRAATRSAMFCDPAPLAVVAGSKPGPLSHTRNTRLAPSWLIATSTLHSPAYFDTFWRASSTQKYTAVSTSWSYRPTPSAVTLTARDVLRAWAETAAGRPSAASRGG